MKKLIYCNFSIAVELFTSTIETKDNWSINDEESEPYFEAGYHDSIAVFYPFEENIELNKNDIIYEIHSWNYILNGIIDDIKDRNFINKAQNIKNRLSNLIANI